MALIETWIVKNNYYSPIVILDIMFSYTVDPGESKDLMSLGNTAESIAGSPTINAAALKIVGSGANAGKRYLDSDYSHLHDDYSETDHTHSGLSVLTGGSDADLLHTHDKLTDVIEVNSLIDIALNNFDLSAYVTKAGNVNQLSDITSPGADIEAAVLKSHDEAHTLLEHLDTAIVTTAKLTLLMDGSNADCCHTHSNLGGTFDGEHNELDGLQGGVADEYFHLTEDQHDIVSRLGEDSAGLTFDGESIGTGGSGGTSIHNDLTGLQGGDVDLDEYYHLSYDEFNVLTNDGIADNLHIHTSYNILLGINCDPSTSYWNDGLFAWDQDTRVACALDDINEVLVSLVPPTPPFLDDRGASTGIDRSSTSGVTADITWSGSGAEALAGYSNVDVSGLSGTVGSSVNYDGEFAEVGDRGGVINKTNMDVTGKINEDVDADTGSPTIAYSADAFAEGSLTSTNIVILELNGSELTSQNVDLTDSDAQDTMSGTDSGLNISIQKQIKFPNGDNYNSYYRTGTWKVDSDDMRNGWNYVRVIHRIDGVNTTTNYVDWVVDDNTTDTSYATTNGLHGLNMQGSQYLSGVRYHTSGTADYDVIISNAFRNTYFTGNVISYTCDNGAISSQSLGDSGGDESLNVTITGDDNFTITTARQLDSTISAATSVNRVFDTDEINDPASPSPAFIDGLLMDPYILGAGGQSDTAESFNAEGYRLESEAGNFSLTNTIYSSGSGGAPVAFTWDEEESLVGEDAGHSNGLLQYGGKLSYPKSTPDSNITNGDFRNAGQGGPGYQEGYDGNPNYSATSGNRVYLRYFYVGASKSNFVFTISGHNFTGFTTVAIGPNGQDLTLELLAPNTTSDTLGAPPVGTPEFKDCYTNFGDESEPGCYTSGTRDADTSDWKCTLGTRSTADSGNTIVIRITASDAWTGDIESISVVAT